MTYENMTVDQLYQACLPSSAYAYQIPEAMNARALAEAQNIMDVWKIVSEWFQAMQQGVANDRYPDPYGDAKVTQQRADKLIQALDDDFQLEAGRFPAGPNSGPGFHRLQPHARLAFAQVYLKALKTNAELDAIAPLQEPVTPTGASQEGPLGATSEAEGVSMD